MELSKETWSQIKEQIEFSLIKDPNITDVLINYQIQETIGTKHILSLSAKIKN